MTRTLSNYVSQEALWYEEGTDTTLCAAICEERDVAAWFFPSSGVEVRRSDGSSDRSYMVDPLSYFSFQPGLHGWG